MKKRVIVSVALVLIVAATILVLTIFQLYKEAEKVQRSIFTNEVLSAGSNIVDKIDMIVKGDTLPEYWVVEDQAEDTTSQIIYQKFAKRFIFDDIRRNPIGVIRTTFNYMKNDVVIQHLDTVIFDTNYMEIFSPYILPWENKESQNKKSKSTIVEPMNSELDSATIVLLNKDFLNRIIREALSEESIDAEYSFAIYNAFTTQFVVCSDNIDSTEMLKSEFIFSLKGNDKIRTPHYLIVKFDAERRIFFQRMRVISSSIIFLLFIISIISVYTLRELYQQKKLSEIKNDFINNMTHEFKTPISSISIASEALKDPDILLNPAISQSYLTIIEEENSRLKEMVNNILQIAQLNKGQLNIQPTRFNVNELIENICNNFSLQFSTRNGTLEKYLYAENPYIYADVHHIENMIINIIENAIKYSIDEPRVVIRTHNEKKQIAISISDSGIGIAKKNIKKIFSDFYREHAGNVHNTKGHGLGLGYVKKIVDLHDGSIVVNSELGKGSEFIIYLLYRK